jgi:hypothetical protein
VITGITSRKKKSANPFALRVVPVPTFEEADAFGGKLREDLFVEQRILFLDDGMNLVADQPIDFTGGLAVGGDRHRIQLELFLDSGLANLEKLVEIAAHDAQEAQAFE